MHVEWIKVSQANQNQIYNRLICFDIHGGQDDASSIENRVEWGQNLFSFLPQSNEIMLDKFPDKTKNIVFNNPQPNQKLSFKVRV